MQHDNEGSRASLYTHIARPLSLTYKALALLLLLGALLAEFAPAHAATITVDTTTDEEGNPGPGTGCSLREAIQSINGAADDGGCTNTGAAYGTGDTINIPAGTYTTTIAGTGEDSNATGDYDILNSVSIVGAGSSTTTIDGNGSAINDRVFDVIGAITVSFTDLTITNGEANNCSPAPGLPSCGGGILNQGGTVNIINSTISNSSTVGVGADGGGIFTSGTTGTVNITNSTISGNSTYYGGAFAGGGDLTVINSTITGNTANFYGGGIYIAGLAVIANSTITGNSAGNSGGGILSFTTLTITNSTISGNSGGGAAVDNFSGTATLSNTIVANQIPSMTDCSGTITSNGNNLESSTSCGFTGELQNTDPLLGALASNGGPTQTMALSVGSPAIDAGDNAICAAAPVNGIDQRGIVRPQGSACDIGAYEVPTAPNGPDLTGDWNPVTQICRHGRCTLRGSVEVRNQGNATAPTSRLRMILSTNAVLGDPDDVVLRESDTGQLRPGQSRTRPINVPLGVSASGKYLFAVIDALNSVGETLETNNTPMYGPIP